MTQNQVEKAVAAIDFIETHLTEKLSLDTVAGAMHYSKYHLHRVFTKTVGLTIHDYVLRRQLTEAAKLLVFSQKPIAEMAPLAGTKHSRPSPTRVNCSFLTGAPPLPACSMTVGLALRAIWPPWAE